MSSLWSLNSEKLDQDINNLKASTLEAMTKTVLPIKLTFTDLTYEVRVKNSPAERKLHKGEKYRTDKILKAASGYALPG